MSHDPAGQFASPYAYGPWSPANGSDPSGALWLLAAGLTSELLFAAASIGFVAGFAAQSIQAAVSGAAVGTALAAGAQGGGMAALSAAVGLAFLNPALTSMVAAISAKAASWVGPTLFVSGLGQAGYGLSQGDFTGVIGLGVSVGIGFAIAQGANGQAGGLSQQKQLDLSRSHFDQRFETPFQRGIWSSVSYVGRILAYDVAAAAVGVVGKPIVLAQDLWALGQSIGALDPASIATNALNTVFDAVVPTYGFYGGAGWGTRQFGEFGIPLPLNRVDWASFHHDINFRHLQWVRSVWSPSSLGLPPGPIGLAYGAIGTPPFALAGALQ